ncbi:MAG: hypothetical protein FWG90_01905 [Oscillospiraceae bacterium]|nr:hypothetical protein [Oscillospiraceae bacterium]
MEDKNTQLYSTTSEDNEDVANETKGELNNTDMTDETISTSETIEKSPVKKPRKSSGKTENIANEKSEQRIAKLEERLKNLTAKKDEQELKIMQYREEIELEKQKESERLSQFIVSWAKKNNIPVKQLIEYVNSHTKEINEYLASESST